jgi:integrase
VRSKSHVLAFTPAQIARLIVEADAGLMLLIQFAAATGMRIGELFGLRWLDVDLETGRVAVRHQYSHGQFAELKTKKARRNIPLPAALLNPLREWKPLLKKAELPSDARFHQLRHSFATALIAGSENAKTVSTLMGHATAAFTMDTYADYWPENFEGIATRVSDRLFADVEAVRAQVGSKLVADEAAEEILGAQVIGLIGGPCRDRTYDQLIKSQLLYQLS